MAFALIGVLLVFVASGGHHEGEDATRVGIFLCYSALAVWAGGTVAAIVGLVQGEYRLVAMMGLILNVAMGVGAIFWAMYVMSR